MAPKREEAHGRGMQLQASSPCLSICTIPVCSPAVQSSGEWVPCLWRRSCCHLSCCRACCWPDRDLNRLDNAKSGRVTDALLNYETVKYFNNEQLEVSNLKVAIEDYQQLEYKLLASLAALNVIQSAVIFFGLISGLLVCTKVGTEFALFVLLE